MNVIKMVPVHEIVSTETNPPKRRRARVALSAEDAKREIGTEIASIRTLQNEMTEFCRTVQQSIATGDFGIASVEAAKRLLDSTMSFKSSVEKVYDIALERTYARLPARRTRKSP